MWSGEGQEHLLQLSAVELAVLAGPDALLKSGRDDGEPGFVQCPGHRRQLRDDLRSVAALLDHPQHTGQLTLCPLEPVDHRTNRLDVDLHDRSLPRYA